VQSNGKYWFAVVGNRNFTKSLEVYSADEKKLVKTVLMAANTTYLTTKDSKLTVSDDFAVLDLHAFPYQMPKKANVSYILDLSGDPEDWGMPTLEAGFDHVQSVVRNSTHADQLVRNADGAFLLLSDEFFGDGSKAITLNDLSIQDGTSADHIRFTYISGANRFIFAYPDWTNECRLVIQSYDADFVVEPSEGISINYTAPWTIEGIYPFDDSHAVVYLYDKQNDTHQFFKVDANNVTNYEILPDLTEVKHNVSLDISTIEFNGGRYFFMMPNGLTRSQSFEHYPVTVTKDFSKTYDLDIGDISTRFVRMVGDRLLVAQSDTITHTKMW